MWVQGDKASSVAKSYSAAIARYGCNTVRPTLLSEWPTSALHSHSLCSNM